MDTTVEALTMRLVALDLHGGTADLARQLPAIHRELVAQLGAPEAHRCFDAALRAAVGRHPLGATRLAG